MRALADDIIELRVPSKPEYVSIVRGLVTDLAHRISLPRSAVEDVQVAVSEACANVVCHAYPGSDNGPTEIVIRFNACRDKLMMEVADMGDGITELAPSRKSDRNGGFGLILIRNLMDHVSLSSSPSEGTVVRMVKNTDSR